MVNVCFADATVGTNEVVVFDNIEELELGNFDSEVVVAMFVVLVESDANTPLVAEAEYTFDGCCNGPVAFRVSKFSTFEVQRL